MSSDVCPYALAEEERLCAGLYEIWPSVPNAPLLPQRPARGEEAPDVRIRAAFAAYPAGYTMAGLLHATGLSWDTLFPMVTKALHVGRLRAVQRPGRKSQGMAVDGPVIYQLQDRR